MLQGTQNPSVRHAKAGDVFHYRWAARRCLKLLPPKSQLRLITVEASKEPQARGEYVIDLAEYFEDEGGRKRTIYYQLKHSIVRHTKPFAFSEVRKTLAGFARRYMDLSALGKRHEAATFCFVSNRQVNQGIKQAIEAIGNGNHVHPAFLEKFERSIGLPTQDLRSFCRALSFRDSEGDYTVQRRSLHGELTDLIAGFVVNDEVDKLIALVESKALPDSDGEIRREEILYKLGISSLRMMFPAPPEYDDLKYIIRREQHSEMVRHILESGAPTFIHAEGGVGKTVVARQIKDSLPAGSVGFLYDCFGSGKYRSPSEPRHRPSYALVQLINEMAEMGLCSTLIAHPSTTSDILFRLFLERLREAIRTLRQVVPDAVIVILIDAADNAERAAQEVNETSFAVGLLRESLPDACRLAYFCRTERISDLKPPSSIRKFLLKPFNETETAAHLRQRFPKAPDWECLELYRLTGGNPRIQANALVTRHGTVGEVLGSLGPRRANVDRQIEDQLQSAMNAITDKCTHNSKQQIESICQGLANLPPFIPLEILAAVAKVEIATIKSFIADLGRALWLSDTSVQFRDEPTEFWFRKTFTADKSLVRNYIVSLEPFAKTFTYVSRVLPQLLLKAEALEQLVNLALSDDLLPQDNPIDERDIRVYRLQFAFKAALRLRRLPDAVTLAMRAGEEVAGNVRQMQLLQANLDLIAPLQKAAKVQELAFSGKFSFGWQGSENLLTASLLSTVKEFHGEANSYLRSAHHWISICFQERTAVRKSRPDPHMRPPDAVTASDLAEFAFAYYNLFGTQDAAKFIMGCKPNWQIFHATEILVNRLIDAGKIEAVEEIAVWGSNNPYLILAVCDRMMALPRPPPKQALQATLEFLANKKKRFENPTRHSFQDYVTPAVISFAEASAACGLSKDKILDVLNLYTDKIIDVRLSGHYQNDARRTFFRGIALARTLAGDISPTIDSLFPAVENSPKAASVDADQRELKEVASALLHWYSMRSRLLIGDTEAQNLNSISLVNSSDHVLEYRYRQHDRLPFEVSTARLDFLCAKTNLLESEIEQMKTWLSGERPRKVSFTSLVSALYASYRLKHLSALRNDFAETCEKVILASNEDSPEEKSDSLISLARSVLPVCPADAAAFFDKAISSVSKFGDEKVERWEAIVSLARRASVTPLNAPSLAYRFMRCGEMIGEVIAREKYWDRDDVFRVGVRLDAPSAFAMLSRWRDREVGWFGTHLKALVIESVSSNILQPHVAWGLSGFYGCSSSKSFAATCIRKAPNATMRQQMFEQAVRDFELQDAPNDHWIQMEHLAKEFTLNSSILDRHLPGAKTKPDKTPILASEARKQNFTGLLKGIDLLSLDGITKALTTFYDTETPRYFESFIAAVFGMVPAGKESAFIEALLTVETLSLYEFGHIVEIIRNNWLKIPSVKAAWKSFLQQIGKRYARDLVTSYRLDFLMDRHSLDVGESESLKEGILDGLSETFEFVEAGIFFGFARHLSSGLNHAEALAVLEFAIGRFELHVDKDFADGLWSDRLAPPSRMSDCIAGFIWNALGSPYAETRWEAAHCVRRLAQYGCKAELAGLLSQLDDDTAHAFSFSDYPFYALHAKLFLLIALSRVALDHPTILRPFAKRIANAALRDGPHILIEIYASRAAIAIENTHRRTYGKRELKMLYSVGRSKFPTRRSTQPTSSNKTPWHIKGQVRTDLKLYFDVDYDRYWFEPLANVFDTETSQVQDLAREYATSVLKIPNTDGYLRDPRQNCWNTLYNRGMRGTRHDHGSHPFVDSYSFYFSFHSLFATASKLLKAMPVSARYSYDPDRDRWQNWLQNHLLIREDGRWLADRRDPCPLKRRAWITDQRSVDFLWGIKGDDFLDCLQNQSSLENSLCLRGEWRDYNHDCFETIEIYSALVSVETARALANSIRTSGDSRGFGLPLYPDYEQDFHKQPPFDVTELVFHTAATYHRNDAYDPYAKDIQFPPDQLNPNMFSPFHLLNDSEGREWRRKGESNPSVLCEIWSNRDLGDRIDEPYRHGCRTSATVAFLKSLCAKTKKAIIFQVDISRTFDSRYRNEDPLGYIPPSRKVFVFTPNGTLVENEKRYQLG